MRVRVRWEHLGEEDDIDEVRAERPKAVDGGDGESHEGGHPPHREDRNPHHPHDLSLARLHSAHGL